MIKISRQMIIWVIAFTVPIVILLIVLQPVIFQSSDKRAVTIGFVDVQKVFENSARGKQQIAAFQEDLSKKSKAVKDLDMQVESEKTEIQKLLQQGNRRLAEQKLVKYQDMQKKLLEAQQIANQELQKTQAEVDKSFMNQLKSVLEELRKQEHLDIIQAYESNKTLSFDPTLDMTQKTLIKYNELYPLGKVSEEELDLNKKETSE